MKNKSINELAEILNSDDWYEKWAALSELEQREVSSEIIPSLEKAIFSDELNELDEHFRQRSKQTTDAREITAAAYGSYEIDMFRYSISQLLVKIGTEHALKIVARWKQYDENME